MRRLGRQASGLEADDEPSNSRMESEQAEPEEDLGDVDPPSGSEYHPSSDEVDSEDTEDGGADATETEELEHPFADQDMYRAFDGSALLCLGK